MNEKEEVPKEDAPPDEPTTTTTKGKEKHHHAQLLLPDIGFVELKLAEEVNFIKELLFVVDKDIAAETLEILTANFKSYCVFVTDGLYNTLQGVDDPVEVQLAVRTAQRDLVEMCFESICQHYASTKPEVIEVLKGMRRLQLKESASAPSISPPTPFAPSRSVSGGLSPRVGAGAGAIGPAGSTGDGTDGGTSNTTNGATKDTWESSAQPQERLMRQQAQPSFIGSFYKVHPRDWRKAFLNWETISNTVTSRLPITRWLPRYHHELLENIRGDLLAAITVGFMLIPQSMAYALLAGLPPVYGLYACLVPLMIYALLGTSSELSIGPVAMVSLLVPTSIEAIPGVQPGTEEYNDVALVLAALSGMILFLAAFLRIGFLVENLLSYPVLNGFVTGAAVIISGSQLKHLLQANIHGETAMELIISLLAQITHIHIWPLLIGGICIVTIFVARRLAPRLPVALCLLILTTLLSYLIGAEDSLDLRVVGDVPGGLPEPRWLRMLSWKVIEEEIPSAIIIAVIGFIESIAVCKKFAAKKQYHVDVTQELYALGLGNIIGSFFCCYPVTGSLSRTAVSYQSGVRTQLASFLTSLLIGVTLLFLTGLFYHTPNCVLAAIVISAAVVLIDFDEPLFLLKIGERIDFAQYVLVLVLTLCLGPELGAGGAIGVSLIQVIYRSARPNFVQIGRLPGTNVYEDSRRHSNVVVIDGILALRFEANLFFANVNWFRELLAQYEAQHSTHIDGIVLDATGVNNLDSSAIHTLHDVITEYQAKKIRFILANVRGEVRDSLHKAGLVAKIGADNFFLTTHDAVQYLTSIQETVVDFVEIRENDNGDALLVEVPEEEASIGFGLNEEVVIHHQDVEADLQPVAEHGKGDFWTRLLRERFRFKSA